MSEQNLSIQQVLQTVIEGQDLSEEQMTATMRAVMSGNTTPAQIAALLAALRMKGETVTELAAAASVMRELSTKVEASADFLVDTCGTGGDTKEPSTYPLQLHLSWLRQAVRWPSMATARYRAKAAARTYWRLQEQT